MTFTPGQKIYCRFVECYARTKKDGTSNCAGSVRWEECRFLYLQGNRSAKVQFESGEPMTKKLGQLFAERPTTLTPGAEKGEEA